MVQELKSANAGGRVATPASCKTIDARHDTAGTKGISFENLSTGERLVLAAAIDELALGLRELAERSDPGRREALLVVHQALMRRCRQLRSSVARRRRRSGAA